MMSQEVLQQISDLREQQLSFVEISRSVDASYYEVNNYYRRFIRTFSKRFDLIVEKLKLSEAAVYKEECQVLFFRVLSTLKKCTKYRNAVLLAPVVVYTIFRSKGKIIKAVDLCRVAQISLSDFKEGLFLVNPACSNYRYRDRQKIVAQLIDKTNAKFHMDMTFKETTKKLFKTCFPLFTNTKDNIVAGLIITLSFVVLDCELSTLSGVFEALGTDTTRAYYHITRKIFKPNGLGNFKGFTDSKSIERLKQYLLLKTYKVTRGV